MFTEKLYGHVKADMMAQNDMEESLEKIYPGSLIGTNGGINLQKPQSMITDLGKALLQAAKSGNTEKVHDLMSRGAPFTADWLGTSPLHLAARYNHVETCKVLLRAGISKDSKTKVDRTPLHLAVFYGNVEIVELLLNSKCEVDAQDMLKMTPLHWAVQKKHDNVVEMLLQQGANPNAESKFGKTPISIATDAGYGDLVRILLLANQMRAASTDQGQTQEATDNLIYELQLHKDRHVDTEEDNITMDLSNDDSVSNLSSSHREDTTDTDNIIEKEDSLSEAITNLAQASETDQRNLDSSTLQMLKDIGITMIPSDDTAGSLITSAIQSGRKVVLSEAGKFALHETRSQLANVYHGKTQYTLPGRAKTVKLVNQTGASQQQSASHAGITPTIKTNKVIKVLTKEEFNQICAGDVSGLKKISATGCKRPLQATAPMRVPQPVVRAQTAATTISSSGQKTVKKIVLSRNRIGSTENLVAKAGTVVNSSGNNGAASAIIGASAIGFHGNGVLGSGSNVSNRHIITSADGVKRMRTSAGLEIISKLPTKIPLDTVVSVEGAPNPSVAHRLVSLNSAVRSFSSSRSSSAATSPISAGTVPAAPVNAILATPNSSNSGNSASTSGMTDIERQVLELKKQNDDLRKQFELLQKQNDDYRLRLEKVEKEVQTLKQGSANNPNNYIEII